MNPSPQLVLVMPAFNEEASIRKVVKEWFDEVSCWEENFLFLAIDDGSTDHTPAILERLVEQLGSRLKVLRKPNSGHGQACLEGYRRAAALGAEWVMQIDSDGQCDPQYFHRLWRERESADVVYGIRRRRGDGWRRMVASAILRWALFARLGILVPDANVPYRLMRVATVSPLVQRIPGSFSLANIALACLCAKARLRIRHVPIRFGERYGGEPKVPFSRFAVKAVELFRQIKQL